MLRGILITAVVSFVLMGLTSWLTDVGIYTPGRQQPSIGQVVKDNYRNGPSAPLGGCD